MTTLKTELALDVLRELFPTPEEALVLDVGERPTGKPERPMAYFGKSSTDVNVWGTNGGWGQTTLTDLNVEEAKFGKSYGVLGTGGSDGTKTASASDLGKGTLFGQTKNVLDQ